MVLHRNLLQSNLQSSPNTGRRKNAITTKSIVITRIKAIQTQNAITTKSVVLQKSKLSKHWEKKRGSDKAWTRVSIQGVSKKNWVYRVSQKNFFLWLYSTEYTGCPLVVLFKWDHHSCGAISNANHFSWSGSVSKFRLFWLKKK